MLPILLALLAAGGPDRSVVVCPVDADGDPVHAARVTLDGAEEPGPAVTGCRTLPGRHPRGSELRLLVTAPGTMPAHIRIPVRRRNHIEVQLRPMPLEPTHDDLAQIRHGYGEPPAACPPGTEGPDAPETCRCVRTAMTRYLFGSCWEEDRGR